MVEKQKVYDEHEIISCPVCDNIDLEFSSAEASTETKCNSCGLEFSLRQVAIWEG